MAITSNRRILLLGQNWVGSSAKAAGSALRRLGHTVQEIDDQVFIPQWHTTLMKICRRLTIDRMVQEYNDAILDAVAGWKPDLLLAYKGQYVLPRTLDRLRRAGIRLYNFYPDTSAFSHGPWLPQTLPLYDCIFFTKPFWAQDVSLHLKMADCQYIPHGYDADLHYPIRLQARDIAEYQHDVVFIGTYTTYKEMVLHSFLEIRPDLDLAIFGNQWEKCESRLVRRSVTGYAVHGIAYSTALQASRICLSIMSGQVQGSSQGDEMTTRSFEIPACRCFMLHERTSELSQYFDEGKEVACFDTPQELNAKVLYYLERENERSSILAAGFNRCVPAYSYDARMKQLMSYVENYF
jgi:glycosyltransferase involved in cell wall biosynthesis